MKPAAYLLFELKQAFVNRVQRSWRTTLLGVFVAASATAGLLLNRLSDAWWLAAVLAAAWLVGHREGPGKQS